MINRKTTLHLILLFSIFAVSAAYFIEYILGHQPCNLCLIERIPYVVSIVVIVKEIKIFNVARDKPKILKVASLQLTVTSCS